MPSRVVGLSRAQAVRLAELERNALELRAYTSSACPELWRRAARLANQVVKDLRRGDDRAASRIALKIGPAWKRAADCEGWATPPLGALTAPQEDKIDRILRLQKEEAAKRKFALVLGALGALFAAARLGIVAVPLIQAAKRRPAPRNKK